jgi:hypothetical protein
MTAAVSVIWRRLDLPGHEAARLSAVPEGWRLQGAAVFRHASGPVRLDYDIRVDARWHTRQATVTGWAGAAAVDIDIVNDADGWRCNGAPVVAVAGCLDIDLGFSPSTNILPIRRLGLSVGAAAPVAAAWLRFPELDLVRLDQTYTRLGPDTWLYESAGGAFRRTLTVDAAGMVIDYPGLWTVRE